MANATIEVKVRFSQEAIEAIVAENERFRQALEWYAKGGRAIFSEDYLHRPVERWDFIATKVAREALEGKCP